MTFSGYTFLEYNVRVECACFGKSGQTVEFQLIFHVDETAQPFAKQLKDIHSSYSDLLGKPEFADVKPAFKRYFLSDSANQQQLLESEIKERGECPVSIIQQPPLDGTKVALWCYLTSETNSAYRHLWTVLNPLPEGDSQKQTTALLNKYENILQERSFSIANDCIRTWFFARDVDVDYKGLVEARRENFNRKGLTEDTHYIASTGIQGASANPNVKVMLDAYAIQGLEDGQVRYLKALDYLSPTNIYGVTFERGTQIDFGDRRKVFISGTASIDKCGNILFLNDVEKQLERTFVNVNALLEEAECSLADMMQLIVYLRDVSDYFLVKKIMDERFPSVPKVIVHAPVCRPGWLIEVECIAEKEIKNSKFRDL